MLVGPGWLPAGRRMSAVICLLPFAAMDHVLVSTVPFTSEKTMLQPVGKPLAKLETVLTERLKLSAELPVLVTKRTTRVRLPPLVFLVRRGVASGPMPKPSPAFAPPATERVFVRSAVLAVTVVSTS